MGVGEASAGSLTIALVGDLVNQSFDLHGQRSLLIEFLLGLPNILADLGPELQLLVIAEPIVPRSGAVAGHV